MVRGSEISLRSRGSGTDHRGVESESASSMCVVGALVKPDIVITAIEPIYTFSLQLA